MIFHRYLNLSCRKMSVVYHLHSVLPLDSLLVFRWFLLPGDYILSRYQFGNIWHHLGGQLIINLMSILGWLSAFDVKLSQIVI